MQQTTPQPPRIDPVNRPPDRDYLPEKCEWCGTDHTWGECQYVRAWRNEQQQKGESW